MSVTRNLLLKQEKKISLGVGPAKPTSEPLEKLGSGLTTVEMPGGGNSKVWVDPAIDET